MRRRFGAVGGTGLVLAGGLAASCASVYPAGPEGDRRLYEGKCGMCHVPFHPSEYTAEEWPALVEQFAPRAGLTKAQRVRVLRHLTSNGGGGAASSASAPPPR